VVILRTARLRTTKQNRWRADKDHTNENQSDEHEHPEGRFAVLVDGHEGTAKGLGVREGTILQHPAFSNVTLESSDQESSFRYQIDESMLEKLKSDGTYRYVDPVAKDPRGKSYAGEWIAAMVRIDVSKRISESQERKQSTNLWVLVQERASSITGPVGDMGSKLLREGLTALLTLIAVVTSLWIVVLWVLRLPDSFAAAVRNRSGGNTELTGTANEATLDADR
jgi:eukaryotic-like serine/threonine-protein kinase